MRRVGVLGAVQAQPHQAQRQRQAVHAHGLSVRQAVGLHRLQGIRGGFGIPLPLLLMGHSMGSFLSRTYLIRYPGTVKAAVLMGTGWQSTATLAGVKSASSQFSGFTRLPLYSTSKCRCAP